MDVQNAQKKPLQVNIDEAIDIYNKIKREDIASVALEYYKNGLITKRVYDGFLNYDFRKFVA